MKAAVWTQYGPPEVLKLQDVPTPEPGPKEVLIKVHCATVTMGDCELRGFRVAFPFAPPLRIFVGLWRPKRRTILGQEMAGTITAIGDDVSGFQVGDPVFGPTFLQFGAYAEFVSLPASYPLVSVPDQISMAQAATIPTGGLNGLHFLRKAAVGKGDKLLINGAGGSIGTLTLQLAKLDGVHVTCVDASSKMTMLSDLGADRVIDYEKEDFTATASAFDAIIDIVGGSPYNRCLNALKPGGRYILGNPR